MAIFALDPSTSFALSALRTTQVGFSPRPSSSFTTARPEFPVAPTTAYMTILHWSARRSSNNFRTHERLDASTPAEGSRAWLAAPTSTWPAHRARRKCYSCCLLSRALAEAQQCSPLHVGLSQPLRCSPCRLPRHRVSSRSEFSRSQRRALSPKPRSPNVL